MYFLPRKSHRQSGGDQETPEGRQGVQPTPGRTADPRAYSRPLGSAPSAAPATQKPPAERRRPRDTGGTPGRTSDPLAVHQVPRLPCKSHRQSGGDQWRDARAYIRPLGSAPSAAPATQKPPAERRRPRDTGGTPGRTSDPLAVHQVPRLPRKSHRQSGGDQGTPEKHPTPWQCTKCHA